MNFWQQLKIALIDAPLALRHIRRQSLVWMVTYMVSGGLVFGLLVYLMLTNEASISNALLDYLFPQSWHEISRSMVDFLFESQAKVVVANLLLSASFVMASVFLFPIKEKYSAVFEKEAQYNNGQVNEFPLIYQAWEESKLFLIYLTFQAAILWIGYYPYQWTSWLSIILSYLFLFFTFGLDFISPTLQRHRTRYSLILKMLLKKPLLVILFGLLYSLPMIFLSQLIFSYNELSLMEIASILFLANLLFLTLAIPAGTLIASRLLVIVKNISAPKKSSIAGGYSVMLLLLVVGLFLHSRLLLSLHHKSQLLKAEYDLDWSSFDYDFPSFSQLANGEATTHLSFDIVINNPTEFDIVIEKSQIFVDQNEKNIATIDLNGFKLPAGEQKRVTIELDSLSNFSQLSSFSDVLDGWRVDLHLQLWSGIPFVINMVEPSS